MPFNYRPELGDDIARVRFHIGDTVDGEHFLSDEEIGMALSDSGSWQSAVLVCIKAIIARLSRPDFRADWLQVSNAEARKGYETLLREKRAEYGIPAISARGQSVYRADSLQDDVPEGW